MGMSSGGKPGGLQSEINATPLIDVLLVLLIIFLVTLPVMMKMVTLEVPRKIDTTMEEPDPNAANFTVLVKADGTITFNDGDKEEALQAIDLASRLRPRLEKLKSDKVVFVDFEDGVKWSAVVLTMDSIRALAADSNHDEVKVALKVKEATDQPAN